MANNERHSFQRETPLDWPPHVALPTQEEIAEAMNILRDGAKERLELRRRRNRALAEDERNGEFKKPIGEGNV